MAVVAGIPHADGFGVKTSDEYALARPAMISGNTENCSTGRATAVAHSQGCTPGHDLRNFRRSSGLRSRAKVI